MTDDRRPPDEEPATQPEAVMLRPEMVVLGDDALGPESRGLEHELVADEGGLPAGTPVAVVEDRGDRCLVADGSGTTAEVARENVRRCTPP